MRPDRRYLLAEEWIAAWRRAGPALEAVRRRELRQTDLRAFLSAVSGMPVIPDTAPRATSGLVEQQRWFRRLAG